MALLSLILNERVNEQIIHTQISKKSHLKTQLSPVAHVFNPRT